MRSVWPHIRLLRPINLMVSAFAMTVCASILKGIQDTLTLCSTIIVVVCYNAAANAYNDVVDYKTDLINRPKRPLVTGYVKIKTARVMTIIFFVMGSVATLHLNLVSKIIAVGIAMPVMILYSRYLKGTPLIGNLTVAFILGLSFIFSGAAYENIQAMVIPACLAIGLTFVRELIKDISDIEGDRKAGFRTFPVLHGVKRSVQLTVFLSIVIGAVSILPFYFGYYGVPYFVVLVLGVEIPLVIIVFSFLKEPAVIKARRFSEVLKISTIAGLIAFFVDSYVN